MMTTLTPGGDRAIRSGPAALPGTPWSVRLARGPATRSALEIYEADGLIAVIADSRVAPQVLGGGRRAARGGRPLGLAWGRLPATGAALTVEFTGGRLRRRAEVAEAAEISGWCWLAVVAGRFGAVTAIHGGARERLRLRAGSWY